MTDDAVLVIGATGWQGGATARALLARGQPVRALVRDPDRPAARELTSRATTSGTAPIAALSLTDT